DIYALGVLLYLLLTGRHPAGPEPHSYAELVRIILEVEPTRPSDLVAPPLRRVLRGDLDTITAKALKKMPGERYESVAAFADDLHGYLRNKPIRARPDSIGYRTSKFLRRHMRSLAAGFVVTFVLAWEATLGHRLWRNSDTPPLLAQQRLTANPHTSPVLNAAISPDGKYLA